MTSSKIETVWKLMSEYKFVFADNQELTCAICRQIMNDPCTSLCGCHFCYRCIEKLDKGGETMCCPGSNTYCGSESLAFGSNVCRDLRTSKIISRLKVNCPNRSCPCCIELIRMADHLRLCIKQPTECPYIAIGCNSDQTNEDTIDAHLRKEALSHSQLMIDLVQNLKNEVSVLRDDFDKSRLEIASLREESAIKETRILIMEEQLRMVKSKMELWRKKKRKKKNNTIENFRDSNENINTESKSGTLLNDSVFYEDDELWGQTLEPQDTETQSSSASTITKELNGGNDYAKVNSKTAEHIHKFDRIQHNIDICRRMCNLYRLFPIINADFAWRIEEYSTKIDTLVFSESFYSNNYKLSLSMYSNSYCKEVYFYCDIMSGDHDEILTWPMRKTMTLSIIDQYTLRTHKCGVTSTRSCRPSEETDDSICVLVAEYSFIESRASIVVDDSIIISCVIGD